MEQDNSYTFERILEEKGQLIYTNVGNSMWPLIREGKDLLVIEPKPQGRLKRYDVPLYRRDSDREAGNGKYVLHRILHVRKESYIITGDNRWNLERDICDRHIVGVLKAVVRGGADGSVKEPKTIYVTDKSYRIYSHIWCDLFFLRGPVLWIRDFPGRALRLVRRLVR